MGDDASAFQPGGRFTVGRTTSLAEAEVRAPADGGVLLTDLFGSTD
ncbi:MULTISPECIES: hypothetical protein [unclassified Streptomyces]|nr:hypothetical protein [Streptomyces sp. PBSH9]